MGRLSDERLAQLRTVVDLFDRGGQPAALAIIDTDDGLRVMNDLRAKLRKTETEEDRILKMDRSRQDHYRALMLTLLIASSGLLGLSATVALALGQTAAAHRRSAESDLARLRAEKEALAERERLVEFQDRFVAILGHDLRNPLAALRMGLRVLERKVPPEQASAIGRMMGSAARMGRMIEQLLDFARSRLGGGIPLAPVATSLRGTVSLVADEERVQHPDRELVVVMAGDLDGVWDPNRLAQVVSNLLGNAMTYGAPDEPVRVETTAGPERVGLAVHNGGPPIPEAVQRVLFDPFRRGERESRAAGTSGLGLGLYITKEIVSAHHGTIAVESNHAGTTFRIELPRKMSCVGTEDRS